MSIVITEHRRSSRIKTETDRLAGQLQRQKSIFKNLNWQARQKDRKIGFLERYYEQLQVVIQKQKQDDIALIRRAYGSSKMKKKNGQIYKSNIIRRLEPYENKRRFVTEGNLEEDGRLEAISEFGPLGIIRTPQRK